MRETSQIAQRARYSDGTSLTLERQRKETMTL